MNVDGKAANLAPGMAATVEIKTGKRKLIGFLLSPLMRMTQEADVPNGNPESSSSAWQGGPATVRLAMMEI